jgi:hypothetical protein
MPTPVFPSPILIELLLSIPTVQPVLYGAPSQTARLCFSGRKSVFFNGFGGKADAHGHVASLASVAFAAVDGAQTREIAPAWVAGAKKAPPRRG